MSETERPSRPYSSPKRQAQSAATRARLVEAATRLLGESGGRSVTLEGVAAAAGVTRLTVYKQFGSRRGLLEEVFDARAAEGGLSQIASAMALPDPLAGAQRLVEVFCAFWGHNAVAALYDAAAADSEFGQALADRNERRRKAISVLVGRLGRGGEDAQRGAVDLVFSLTSYETFRSLASRGRSAGEVAALLSPICDSVLRRLSEE